MTGKRIGALSPWPCYVKVPTDWRSGQCHVKLPKDGRTPSCSLLHKYLGFASLSQKISAESISTKRDWLPTGPIKKPAPPGCEQAAEVIASPSLCLHHTNISISFESTFNNFQGRTITVREYKMRAVWWWDMLSGRWRLHSWLSLSCCCCSVKLFNAMHVRISFLIRIGFAFTFLSFPR